MRRKLIVTGAAVLTLAGGGAGAALAVGGDDGEGRVSGLAADRAAVAAVRHTNGGTVNAVERDGEKGAVWEVEVTRPDGKTVDVRLAGDLALVAVDGDTETESGETP